MPDLSFYNLLVAVKSFEPVTEELVADYCTQDNRLDIDGLFMVLTAGKGGHGSKSLNDVINYCASTATALCNGYGIAEKYIPIFRAYLIPYDYNVTTDEDKTTLVSLYEAANTITIDENDNPVWYLREDLRYRLLSLYAASPDDIEKIRMLLPKVNEGKERYDEWLLRER